MQEIQSATSIEWIKYGLGSIGVLATIINALMIYIFQSLKKDVEKIKVKQDSDHDKIIRLETSAE